MPKISSSGCGRGGVARAGTQGLDEFFLLALLVQSPTCMLSSCVTRCPLIPIRAEADRRRRAAQADELFSANIKVRPRYSASAAAAGCLPLLSAIAVSAAAAAATLAAAAVSCSATSAVSFSLPPDPHIHWKLPALFICLPLPTGQEGGTPARP